MICRIKNLSSLPSVLYTLNFFFFFWLIIQMRCRVSFHPLDRRQQHSTFPSWYLPLFQIIYFSFDFWKNPFYVKGYSYHGGTPIMVKYMQVYCDKIFKSKWWVQNLEGTTLMSLSVQFFFSYDRRSVQMCTALIFSKSFFSFFWMQKPCLSLKM